MTTPDTVEEQPQLRRVMGPGLLLLFVVGDILGTGVYALTGDVAAEVGGAAWVPFLVSFLIATVTAFSYLELVTKYPQAAGAALYVHKAFGIQFVTFLVAFVVMCSGITSASTASRFFAANFETAFGFEWGKVGIVVVAMLFMAMLATVNLRGVGESVKLNVGLTIIEITGLLLVILVGLWAFTGGGATSTSPAWWRSRPPRTRTSSLRSPPRRRWRSSRWSASRTRSNMAEETKDPVRTFPKVLLTGLAIAGVVYVIVSIVAVALVPVGELEASDTPLVEVVKAGAPGLPIEDILPFISMFAVSNTALINMLMASRLIYGMARQHVLPPMLGTVHPTRLTPWVAIVFTTLIAFGLIFYVTAFANSRAIAVLGGTTALLLLAVFAMVNVAVLVLRRDVREAGSALQDADGVAGDRVHRLAVSGDAAVRPARAAVCVGADSSRHRHSAVLPHHGDQPSGRYPRRGHHRSDAPGFRAGLTAQLPTDGGQLALCPLDLRLNLFEARNDVVGVGLLCRTPPRCGCEIGRQRRRDDVARRGVAICGHVLRPVIPVERDVRANHGVDGILVPVELYRAGRGLHPSPQLHPGHVVVHAEPWRRPVEPLDQCHQVQQFAPAVLDLALLVLQDLWQTEQHDRRRVWEDLDGPPLGTGLWVHVKVQPTAEHSSARRIEQRIGFVGGMGTRIEPREVLAQLDLRDPAALGIGDDQRGVDGNQAFVADVGSDCGLDAGVVLGATDVEESAVGVDSRDAGVVFLAPRKIEPNEVHTPTVPDPAPTRRRKLCVCDDP